MKKFLILILMVNFIFAAVGKISAINGEAYVIRQNNSIPVKLGMQIEKKDNIKTKNGQLQIIFTDRTIITIGKNSSFSIKNYLFDNKNPKAEFGLSKGIIKTITGKISKIAPQRFHIKTKNALIGIRGTIFIVEVKNNSVTLTMIEGITTFKDLIKNKTYFIKQGEQIIFNPNAKQRIIIHKTKKIPLVISTIFTSKKSANNLITLLKNNNYNITSTTKITEDDYSLGYLSYKTPITTWHSMKYSQTSEDEIQDLIDNETTASYSGKIVAITDEGIATGDTALKFDFGDESWSGSFDFKTDDDNEWKFSVNEGSLNTKGFSGKVDDTADDSDAKNISGDIVGKFYGTDALTVGGEGDLSSDNKGDAKMSFGATKDDNDDNGDNDQPY